MSSSLDKLKALNSRLENRLGEKKSVTVITLDDKNTLNPLSENKLDNTLSLEVNYNKTVRNNNINIVKTLYNKLQIIEKSPDFENIFIYKAMNLSGIGLKEEDFGEVRKGKYIQVIAITYEPDKNGKKKAKNISLGYFGKAETLDESLKNNIIEFVLRWRYEKAFQNVEHYKGLIERVGK